jgi:hypothetical protein
LISPSSQKEKAKADIIRKELTTNVASFDIIDFSKFNHFFYNQMVTIEQYKSQVTLLLKLLSDHPNARAKMDIFHAKCVDISKDSQDQVAKLAEILVRNEDTEKLHSAEKQILRSFISFFSYFSI